MFGGSVKGCFLAQAHEGTEADDGPCGEATGVTAHEGDVPEQEAEGEETGDVELPAVELLDGDGHHVGDEGVHPRADVEGRGGEGGHIEVGGVAQDVVGHIVAQAPGVEGTADDTADVHVHEVEHGERLEEVLEGHDLMQAPHQRDAQHGIAEAPEHEGQAQHLDVDMVGHEEVEAGGIEGDADEAEGDELIDVEGPHLQPQP